MAEAEAGGAEDSAEEEEEIPTMQKVAILMVSLGEDASGEVMKHLSDFEIEEITQAIAGLKNIGTDLMDSVLEEFEQSLLAGLVGIGGRIVNHRCQLSLQPSDAVLLAL